MRHALSALMILSLFVFNTQASVLPNGQYGDDRVSVGYNPTTGEVFWDTAGQEIEQLLILSSAGNFSGDPSPLELCDAVFCQDTDFRIEKLGFALPIKDGSFGNVAAKHLSQEALLTDWTVSGRLYPSGMLDGGRVDLIYVPEPSAGALALMGLALAIRRRA